MNRLLSSMITNQSWINQSEPDSGERPTKIQRRTLLRGALGGALAALLASPRRVIAQGKSEPNNPFVLLLKGVYQSVPVGQGPNLGLTAVNLNDGTYSVTQIHAVTRIPGSRNEDNAVVGNFYVSLTTGLCAYDLPGGAIAMQFTGGGFPMLLPDGTGGQFDEGTFELTILEATGVYKAFQGGHNHMVDRLHQLKAGSPLAGFPSSGYNEFCFCIISRPPNPLSLWWTSN